MSKERIFELIRKEEVVLFVGAGMSLYAGYPSGVKLAETLFNNLTADIQNEVSFTTDLPKLAEEIYNIKGGNKNYIFEILKKEFQKVPSSTETHELLAKIPQIKTIITTNYDTLLESTNKNLEVIRKSSDYPIANPKKQWLFKIHGDLLDTNTIILTNSDYNNYFVNDKEDTVFWNAVKDKLAANHILFVGYSMEDSTISVIIEKILNELGENRKELFFVAPSISQPKLKFLQRKGIEYIEATGEELFKEINEDLKYNYLPGLKQGIGTADTAFDFAKVNNISLGLSKSKDIYLVDNISSLNGVEKNEVKFKIDGGDENSQKIIDSIRGKDFEDVVLNGNLLKEFNHYFNGIRIDNGDSIKSLLIKKVPAHFGLFTITCEDGFEIDNYYLEIFIVNPNELEAKMKIKANDFDILIDIDFPVGVGNYKFKIVIVPSDEIKSVKSGINFYSILSRITSNQKFKIFKDNKLLYNYREKILFDEEAFDAHFLLDYFNQLKKIENYFDVKFTAINLENANEHHVMWITAYIDKIALEEEFIGMTFKNENKEEFDHIISNGEKDRVLVISDNKKSVFDLHGIDFTIGYLHKYVKDAFVANLEDLKNDSTKEISMKSKSNILYYQFSDNETMISN